MKKKYDPNSLLLSVAHYFEREGKIKWPVLKNDQIAEYIIRIEIKESSEEFTIIMDNQEIKLLRGVGGSRRVLKHDELEKNKEILGPVTVFKKKEVKNTYPSYEKFIKLMLGR